MEIQLCIIHQIRNFTKYISWKDIKEFMADLKTVYKAIDEKTALENLDKMEENEKIILMFFNLGEIIGLNYLLCLLILKK